MKIINPTLQQGPIVLVCGADDNYAMPLAVMVHSVLANLEKNCPLQVYIIDGGLSEKSKQRINRVLHPQNHGIDVTLEFSKPDLSLLADLKTHGWINSSAYLRLFIPDIVSANFNKAIYLDCDLFVEANLQNLWSQKIENYALLAVQDYGSPYVSAPLGLVAYEELGLAPDTPYFNSGVLVFNLSRWRTEKISNQVFSYLHKYKDVVQMEDQDGLNAVLANEWGMLDLKWNVVSHLLYYQTWPASAFKNKIGTIREELLHSPYIVHFAGGSKPWQIGCDHPAQLRWIRYLKNSKWFEPLEGIFWLTKWFIRYYWSIIKSRLIKSGKK